MWQTSVTVGHPRRNVEVDLRESGLAGIEASPATVSDAFDWRNCWYPVTFLDDLPRDRPTGFTLYDEQLVLFVDGDEQVICLTDRCSHRAARLSDGRLVDGRIECLYHGWQYGAKGECLHIPQLPANLQIPRRACVRAYPVAIRQGMVWIWAGEPERADEFLIPVTPAVDSPGITKVDFQIDLPYDQSYLIENVIDVAHIHIAHDGVRGGGIRAAAKPLEFDVQESSIRGIRSGFRTMGAPENSILKGAVVEFIAPNLIRYTSEYRDAGLIAGLSLYSLPLGRSRCRLLYRKYSNFTSWKERIKPRWLEHWTQCLILEQDMGVVIGQHEHIERAQGRLGNLWCILGTSDRLVVEYRKWLDRFGKELPFYRGLDSAKAGVRDPFLAPLPANRYALHTRVCGTCGRLYRNVQRAVQGLWAGVAVLTAIAIVSAGGPLSYAAVALGLLGLAGIAALGRLKAQLQ
jgi:phenylpropionate dioxygenase-like ring-hydroxylating dioxygenase large terminal subunit